MSTDKGPRLCLYQAGDYIDDYAKDAEWRNDYGALFTASYSCGGANKRYTLSALDVTPVILSLAQTNVAQGNDATVIARRLRGLSAELGTQLFMDESGALHWRAGEQAAA